MTPIQQALEKIIEFLQQISADIIPHDHIGIKWPASNDDLPRVVISVSNIKELNTGIGKIIGILREDDEHISTIKSLRVSGLFQLNTLDFSPKVIDAITTAFIEIISQKSDELVKEGFIDFSLESISEIALLKNGSTFFGRRDVWNRLLVYKGIYELIDKETFGSGSMIKEIHASIGDVNDEKIILKK